MIFLELAKWFEIKLDENNEPVYSDMGWISITELEAYDPDNTLLDSYEVMKEFTNPLGSIFWFLVKKCLLTQRTEHQQ